MSETLKVDENCCSMYYIVCCSYVFFVRLCSPWDFKDSYSFFARFASLRRCRASSHEGHLALDTSQLVFFLCHGSFAEYVCHHVPSVAFVWSCFDEQHRCQGLPHVGIPKNEVDGLSALRSAVATSGMEPLADPLTLLRFYRQTEPWNHFVSIVLM